jgi:putative ABC transport system substrate-binding protein
MPARTVGPLLVAAGLLLTAAADVESQGTLEVARIGYLSPLTAASDELNRSAFQEGLQALGYVHGRNAVIEARYADGDLERLSVLASEIVRFRPDVIVAATTTAVRAVQKATPTLPW